MRKVVLIILLTSSLVYSQSPTVQPASVPTRDAANVISFFGGDDNSYGDISGVDFQVFWSQPVPPWVAPDLAFNAAGNMVLKYTSFGYQGLDFSGNKQNVAGMEFLHIDIWTNSSSVDLTLLSAGSGDFAFNFSANQGFWTSVDIPLTHFAQNINLNLAELNQMKFYNGNGDDIYIDNLYFWKPEVNSADDATLKELQVDGISVSAFSGATTFYTHELIVGTSVAPTITATTTQSDASILVTQATSIPGEAIVVVTAPNQTKVKTYTVSFIATLPGAAEFISSPADEVLALLDNISNGTAVSFWNPSYFFGTSQGVVNLDGNNAVKMDFSVAGWGGGINNGSDVYTDVSTYNFVNFSYFVPEGEPGVNGHEVKFILIGGGSSPSGNGNGEFSYTLKEAGQGGDADLVFNQWVNLTVPLTHFVNNGWSTDNFFQFKLGSISDLNTKVIYFDNIFFSVNEGQLVGLNELDIIDLSAFPNPSNTMWNIKTSKTLITSIDVFNSAGKRVVSLKNKSNEVVVSTEGLVNGIYIARVTTGMGTKSFLLTKK
ncbi:MAG: T9SS type A sorting domain-containing protein [Flavobacteriales bacterium]|nr:T9SS type A sorting domain-containing protein [Flavobacteriales bacterium]